MDQTEMFEELRNKSNHVGAAAARAFVMPSVLGHLIDELKEASWKLEKLSQQATLYPYAKAIHLWRASNIRAMPPGSLRDESSSQIMAVDAMEATTSIDWGNMSTIMIGFDNYRLHRERSQSDDLGPQWEKDPIEQHLRARGSDDSIPDGLDDYVFRHLVSQISHPNEEQLGMLQRHISLERSAENSWAELTVSRLWEYEFGYAMDATITVKAQDNIGPADTILSGRVSFEACDAEGVSLLTRRPVIHKSSLRLDEAVFRSRVLIYPKSSASYLNLMAKIVSTEWTVPSVRIDLS